MKKLNKFWHYFANMVFDVDKKNLNIEIAKWLSEYIKSILRKDKRYQIDRFQILSMIRLEFNFFIEDSQLSEILKECSFLLYSSHIKMYIDSNGIVAGRKNEKGALLQ